MKKRNLLFIGLGILVVIAATVATYAMTRPATTTQSLSRGMTYAEAKRMPATVACLTEDATLTLSASERIAVELAVMTHLYDVPAGTNLDILIASYSEGKVTGSEHYPDTYGSYNFTMTRQAGASWHFTKFERCT